MYKLENTMDLKFTLILYAHRYDYGKKYIFYGVTEARNGRSQKGLLEIKTKLCATADMARSRCT